MAAIFSIALVLTLAVSASAGAQGSGVSVQPIPDHVWSRMQGRSWRSDLPCPKRGALALLTVPYWDFEGRQQRGLLIVARSVADDVAGAFQEIYESRQFRIAKMRLIDAYDGSDDASMDDNNTSGFNCRTVVGTGRLSKHALGLAVDINPIQNPYREGPKTSPRAGRKYDEPHERKASVVGLIRKGDVVTTAFSRIGWTWGGDFRHTKDYQHFAR
ncbi:MAG: M15 family metallopeptidase [Beijerinckiaceae bacterium]|nr:M15 family metallopeptidase [Beijerinckiaceae bacterium]